MITPEKSSGRAGKTQQFLFMNSPQNSKILPLKAILV